MEEAKRKLIKHLYECFAFESLSAIILFLCIVLLTIIAFVNFSKYDAYQRKLLLIVILGITIIFGILIFTIHLCRKDYKYLESNGGPIYIEGELIGFDREYYPEGGVSISRSGPIIRINGTNEEITLIIKGSGEKMKIGETYEIVYLPYTKFAEIIE